MLGLAGPQKSTWNQSSYFNCFFAGFFWSGPNVPKRLSKYCWRPEGGGASPGPVPAWSLPSRLLPRLTPAWVQTLVMPEATGRGGNSGLRAAGALGLGLPGREGGGSQGPGLRKGGGRGGVVQLGRGSPGPGAQAPDPMGPWLGFGATWCQGLTGPEGPDPLKKVAGPRGP